MQARMENPSLRVLARWAPCWRFERGGRLDGAGRDAAGAGASARQGQIRCCSGVKEVGTLTLAIRIRKRSTGDEKIKEMEYKNKNTPLNK